LVLVWPILLPAGIDTGIGNAFLSPNIFNTFQQYFFKNSGTTETSSCHRTLKKGDAARLSNSIARESNQDQTQVTAATPPSKNFFPHITSKRNATIARPDADAKVE